jgi:hypothetical protein
VGAEVKDDELEELELELELEDILAWMLVGWKSEVEVIGWKRTTMSSLDAYRYSCYSGHHPSVAILSNVLAHDQHLFGPVWRHGMGRRGSRDVCRGRGHAVAGGDAQRSRGRDFDVQALGARHVYVRRGALPRRPRRARAPALPLLPERHVHGRGMPLSALRRIGPRTVALQDTQDDAQDKRERE